MTSKLYLYYLLSNKLHLLITSLKLTILQSTHCQISDKYGPKLFLRQFQIDF
jgi:hypothetical protein